MDGCKTQIRCLLNSQSDQFNYIYTTCLLSPSILYSVNIGNHFCAINWTCTLQVVVSIKVNNQLRKLFLIDIEKK